MSRARVHVVTTSVVSLVVLLGACGGGGGGGGGGLARSSSTSSSSTARSTSTTTTSTTTVDSGRDDSTSDTSAAPASDAPVATETAPPAGAVPADGGPVEPGPDGLVGTWLGPMPGDSGRCGAAVSEWTMGGDGTYQVANRSTDCGGFTVFGTYAADATSIAFEQQGSDCPTCIQTASYSVEYSFVSDTNSLQIVDGTQSFILHRE